MRVGRGEQSRIKIQETGVGHAGFKQVSQLHHRVTCCGLQGLVRRGAVPSIACGVLVESRNVGIGGGSEQGKNLFRAEGLVRDHGLSVQAGGVNVHIRDAASGNPGVRLRGVTLGRRR